MEQCNLIYVITGGSGFGKSTLVTSLAQKGYATANEFAREIIQEQQEQGGSIVPWKDIRSFQQQVLNKRIDFYQSVKNGEIAFSDRAIPDQIAFARFKGFKTPEILVQASQKYRYHPTVFITPPWKEIYKNDPERTETYEKACELHQYVTEVYRELDYTLVEIPKMTIEKRVEFILKVIIT